MYRLHNHHYNWGAEYSNDKRLPFKWTCNHILFSPKPWDINLCFLPYCFAIPIMLYKPNHTVYTLLRLPFSITITSLRFIFYPYYCAVTTVFLFIVKQYLTLWIYKFIPQFLPLRNISVISCSESLSIHLLQTSMYRFWSEYKYYLSRANTYKRMASLHSRLWA